MAPANNDAPCPPPERLSLLWHDEQVVAHIGICLKCQKQIQEALGQDSLAPILKRRQQAALAGNQPHTGSVCSSQDATPDSLMPARSAAEQKRFCGWKIGRFELRNRLGEGGMGEVWEAYDTNLDRRVALKLLKPHYLSDVNACHRFLQEGQAAAKIAGEYVVKVHEADQATRTLIKDDGTSKDEGTIPYLVMELIEGETLEKYLEKSVGRLSIPAVIDISEQLAWGLADIHNAGIVHRDLKPANIFIVRGRVKIGDFGLVHMPTEHSKDLTICGEIIGTPRYMAPEQARGQSVDHRADLFSVGVIVYELLTGDTPIRRGKLGNSEILASLRIIDTLPLTFPNRTPLDLEYLIRQLLEVNPAGPGRGKKTAQQIALALQAQRKASAPTLLLATPSNPAPKKENAGLPKDDASPVTENVGRQGGRKGVLVVCLVLCLIVMITGLLVAFRGPVSEAIRSVAFRSAKGDTPDSLSDGEPRGFIKLQWHKVDPDNIKKDTLSGAKLPQNGLSPLEDKIRAARGTTDVVPVALKAAITKARTSSGYDQSLGDYFVFISSAFREVGKELAWDNERCNARVVAYELEDVGGGTKRVGGPFTQKDNDLRRISLALSPEQRNPTRSRWLVLFIFPLDADAAVTLKDEQAKDPVPALIQ